MKDEEIATIKGAAKYLLRINTNRAHALAGSLLSIAKNYPDSKDREKIYQEKYKGSLYELVMNFDKMLFDENRNPIAEYWTVASMPYSRFWEIGDVREDGTYLCYGWPDRYLDMWEKVIIQYK